jgi:hypothetical protein
MKKLLAVVAIVAAIELVAHAHTSHSAPVPTRPVNTPTAPATPAAPAARTSPAAPLVIDGLVQDVGSDPYQGECSGSRLVDVHPDTPAHRRDAARLCQESQQDQDYLEDTLTKDGAL